MSAHMLYITIYKHVIQNQACRLLKKSADSLLTSTQKYQANKFSFVPNNTTLVDFSSYYNGSLVIIIKNFPYAQSCLFFLHIVYVSLISTRRSHIYCVSASRTALVLIPGQNVEQNIRNCPVRNRAFILQGHDMYRLILHLSNQAVSHSCVSAYLLTVSSTHIHFIMGNSLWTFRLLGRVLRYAERLIVAIFFVIVAKKRWFYPYCCRFQQLIVAKLLSKFFYLLQVALEVIQLLHVTAQKTKWKMQGWVTVLGWICPYRMHGCLLF